MKTFASLLVVLLAAGELMAFDSADWHGKRELMAREAERLRGVYSNCLAQVRAPAENVTVPVEAFDDGAVKVVVKAKKAQIFLKEGLVWAEGVVVERFREDGRLESRLEAENCVVDRKSRSGWAEGPATVRHGETVFRGRGVFFSAADSYVKVFESADVESKDLKLGGAAL